MSSGKNRKALDNRHSLENSGIYALAGALRRQAQRLPAFAHTDQKRREPVALDRRIEKTERAIREAFLTQRAEKPLEKIRVRELCEAAEINKSTFYAHYQDVYALADAMEGQLVESILAQVAQIRTEDLRGRPEWLTRELFRAFTAHGRQVEILFSGSRRGALVDRLERGLRELTSREIPGYWDDPVRSVVLSFCVQGSYYAFQNNSGRLDEAALVQVLGAVSRAAQNIGPLMEKNPRWSRERRKPMYPTRQQAQALLAEAQARYSEVSEIQGRWADHCRTAAACAEKIAARCPGLDPDKAYVLGLLHDIGRRYGDGHLRHVYYGWKYMQEQGFEDVARICLTHSFQIQGIDAYIGHRDIPAGALEELTAALDAVVYDDYDRLIQLCDSIAGVDGPVDMAARMEDVRRRYGSYPQDKWNRNFELKGYFEHWAGADLYAIVGQPV